jgi:hypothetical protein
MRSRYYRAGIMEPVFMSRYYVRRPAKELPPLDIGLRHAEPVLAVEVSYRCLSLARELAHHLVCITHTHTHTHTHKNKLYI